MNVVMHASHLFSYWYEQSVGQGPSPVKRLNITRFGAAWNWIF
jgi:hypothetical protein